MPILGSDMEAGTLVSWAKRPGDVIHRGDVIATVETDKADVEVEAFIDGTIDRLLVEPGTRVPVGTPLAIITETPGSAPVAALAATPAAVPAPAAAAPEPAPVRQPAQARSSARGGPASPAARQLAARLHVDLATVAGSGPSGRIQLRDIERAAAAPPAEQPVPVDRQLRMRQAIAAAMERSAREIPQFHLVQTIDLTRALDWLAAENEKRPLQDRLLAGAVLIKAVARTLKDVPELNAVWAGDRVALKPAIHVGVAIALRDGGLIAPALHDADQCSIDGLMKGLRDLVQRTRAGTLKSSEIGDATITVTSLGDQGVDAVYGLIYPPQVALVGFGRIAERPWSVDGQVVSRRLVTATLTADHRVSDGHQAGRFLTALDRRLQEPEQL